MNTWIKSAMMLSATLATTATFAQNAPAKPKVIEKNEEIIIRKKGDTKEKTTIVINGDDVTVNGKPLNEYKGENVTVMKMRRNGAVGATAPRARVYSRSPKSLTEALDPMNGASAGNKAMLGVVTAQTDGGVKINSVTEESGAAKAGLKEEDVITKVGDAKIETPADLVAAISKHKPADKVEITYKRDGKENKTTATLSENKSMAFSFNLNDENFHFEMPERPFVPNLDGSMFSWNRKPKIGMQIQDLEEGAGVKVQDVDDESPAEKSGFKEGDVITSINGKSIAGVDDLKQQIKDVKEGDSFKVEFKRDGKSQTAEIKIPKRLKTADL